LVVHNFFVGGGEAGQGNGNRTHGKGNEFHAEKLFSDSRRAIQQFAVEDRGAVD